MPQGEDIENQLLVAGLQINQIKLGIWIIGSFKFSKFILYRKKKKNNNNNNYY